MAATPWFGGSNPSDDIELRNLSVCLSRALFMRLRLVSVVGQFLWYGDDDNVQCFLVVIDNHRACCSEFGVTVMPAIYIDLASH